MCFCCCMEPIRNSWCTTVISDNGGNVAVLQRSSLCLLAETVQSHLFCLHCADVCTRVLRLCLAKPRLARDRSGGTIVL